MLQQTFDERNRDLIVNINGRLVAPRPGAASARSTPSVQGGDAVWEGLRLYDGRIFRLDEHLDRLRRSALALAFARDPVATRRSSSEIRRTLAANGMRDGVHIRLTLTRGVKITSGMDPRLNQSGPTLIVLAEHKPPVYDTGGHHADHRAASAGPPPDCLDPKIHHNNLLHVDPRQDRGQRRRRRRRADARRARLRRRDQRHAPVLRGRRRRCARRRPRPAPRASPARRCSSSAAAHGIPSEVGDLSLTEVYRADEVFCTGTMGELAPVLASTAGRSATADAGSADHAAVDGLRRAPPRPAARRSSRPDHGR